MVLDLATSRTTNQICICLCKLPRFRHSITVTENRSWPQSVFPRLTWPLNLSILKHHWHLKILFLRRKLFGKFFFFYISSKWIAANKRLWDSGEGGGAQQFWVSVLEGEHNLWNNTGLQVRRPFIPNSVPQLTINCWTNHATSGPHTHPLGRRYA